MTRPAGRQNGEGNSVRRQAQVHMRMRPNTLPYIEKRSDSLIKLDGHLENIMEVIKAIN